MDGLLRRAVSLALVFSLFLTGFAYRFENTENDMNGDDTLMAWTPESPQPDNASPGGAPYAANVLDYGADPRGKEDSTEAIQKACNENKHVYLPTGIYKISALSIFGSVTLQGAGNNVTTIKTTNLTDNVITFKSDGWNLKDLKFDASNDRTGGAYVYSSANYASIQNVSLTRHYIGFDLDGCWSVDIQNINSFDGTPHETAEGGAAIRLGHTSYTGPINIRGMMARPADGSRQPTSCITMGHVDVVHISDVLIIHHRKEVMITPKDMQFAALIEITNCCFDTAESGIFIQPTGGARVLRCGIANTWFGAHSGDAMVIDASDGVVTGLQFTNAMFLANRGNGVTITGSGTDGIFFSNSFSGGNLGHGLYVAEGAKNIVWSGGVIGATHELNGNVKYGYTAEKGCSGSIINTILTGNTEGVSDDPSGAFKTSGNTTE
ncbi:MAG: glycoside hydrolase family 55 protein [Clostridiales bacterium]|jgi:hypothetical protein|nr:glycoside hydrolase family 55 protein [Clostridiales bacterium]